MKNKSTYFVSDFHLGFDDKEASVTRENKIIEWLRSIQEDCASLFLLGDVFDYWFEYAKVIPKGYIGLFSKLYEFTSNGIPVHFLKGNHDMWVGEFFSSDLGIRIHDSPLYQTINGKKFLLHHGDGLGREDSGYRRTKWVFENKTCQRLFSHIHPYLGLYIMKTYSSISRRRNRNDDKKQKIQAHLNYCSKVLSEKKVDYFVMGHFHYPVLIQIDNSESKYANTGDWIDNFSYVKWDGENFELLFYDNQPLIE